MSFKKPINASVTQRFGADFQQADGRWYYKNVLGYSGHNGDDYAAPLGTPVYAADEGTVAFEGWGQNHSWMGTAAGICVLIDNGGVYSGYAHLNSNVVNKGDHVDKGQLIGYVGSTGAATGPHLHFEALPKVPNFKNGFAGRIDPAQFMELPKTYASVEQVQDAYRTILEREADQEGIDHYTQYSIDFVRSDLASSQEYRDVQARKEAERIAQEKAQAEREQAELARLAAEAKAAEEAKKGYTDADRQRDAETNNLVKQILAKIGELIAKFLGVFK